MRRRHSLLYILYLRSPLWRLRRRLWILRAGGRCQQCHRPGRLTIHHRTYHRLAHERRSDTEVLCWNCHQRRHPSPLAARVGVPPGWRYAARYALLLLAIAAVIEVLATSHLPR
jgi:5-methylcytosine-specific restriction endonuclease McrA